MKSSIVLTMVLLALAACGKEEPPVRIEAASQAPGYSKYPYFFTLMCDGKITSVVVSSSADEPAKCPND